MNAVRWSCCGVALGVSTTLDFLDPEPFVEPLVEPLVASRCRLGIVKVVYGCLECL